MADRRHSSHATAELLQTERTYCQDLSTLQNVIVEALREHLTPQQLTQIFSNTGQLLGVSESFITGLQTKSIGTVFREVGPYLKMYTTYCSGYSAGRQLLERLEKDNSSIADTLRSLQSRPELKNLPVNAFLIMPVQRICRYPLLLKEILKGLEAGTPEHEDIASTLRNIVEPIVIQVNSDTNKAAMIRLVEEIEDGDKLVDPARHFCRENFFLFHGGGSGELKRRQVILFNDMLLVVRRKPYLSKGKIAMRIPFTASFSVSFQPKTDNFDYGFKVQIAQTDEKGVSTTRVYAFFDEKKELSTTETWLHETEEHSHRKKLSLLMAKGDSEVQKKAYIEAEQSQLARARRNAEESQKATQKMLSMSTAHPPPEKLTEELAVYDRILVNIQKSEAILADFAARRDHMPIRQITVPEPKPDFEDVNQPARCILPYLPARSTELALNVGEQVMVLRRYSDGWLEGVIGSDRGLFPADYVQFDDDDDDHDQSSAHTPLSEAPLQRPAEPTTPLAAAPAPLTHQFSFDPDKIAQAVRIQTLEATLEQRSQENSALTAETAILRERVAVLESANAGLTSQLHRSEKLVRTLEAENATLRSLHEEPSSLKLQPSEVAAREREFKQEIERLAQQVAELQAQVAALSHPHTASKPQVTISKTSPPKAGGHSATSPSATTHTPAPAPAPASAGPHAPIGGTVPRFVRPAPPAQPAAASGGAAASAAPETAPPAAQSIRQKISLWEKKA